MLRAPARLATLASNGTYDTVVRLASTRYRHFDEQPKYLHSLSLSQVSIFLALCLITYICSLVIYRLYLSPVAHFPGPFLARTTHWYEFYYNYVRTGMYYKKIAEFHEKYGPVVRVTPEEIHVRDSTMYQDLFVTGAVRKTEAYQRFSRDETTILDHLVHSPLVEQELGDGGFARLAQLIQQAGAHNVSHTLSTITMYLLHDKSKLGPLLTELDAIWKSHEAQSSTPSWTELEKAPYLSACMNRAPRVFPYDDMEVCGWTIPRGTPVSMTTYWMHNDPAVFPDPSVYNPNRWIDADPEHLKAMRTYYVPFAKGSRNCVGQNLVYMQLFHTLARMFRPGSPIYHLHDTTLRDVVAIHGLLFPLPPLDTNGVRVRVS
ncbi:cytochrome P450 [Periconia macrospinosa]|uniref:Cytochrome P450 n=1 Tax=Periconia macrospinosa TaxID=97972 RepID=A0A2V1DTD9_9PLEO|nr:cytochrome P450 [Periconia macrospinosa]